MSEKNDSMEKLISLAKRRGFIYQGSEIYGGLAGTWDLEGRKPELACFGGVRCTVHVGFVDGQIAVLQ